MTELKKILNDYQEPVEFSCSPFKLPRVSEMNENSSGNQLEKTLKDSLAGEEALVNQIKQDILDGVSSSQRTEQLVKESSENDKSRKRFAKLFDLYARGQIFYQKHRKIILIVVFFLLFWKLILLILWILI